MRLGQDLKFAWRRLQRAPGFAVVAVLTLGLGIGANTAIFSIVNALFLHPPGVADPGRVVVERARYSKLGLRNIVVSVPDFAAMRDSRQIVAAAALEQSAKLDYTGAAYPQQFLAARVGAQWFDVFGARPIVGRTFTAEEDQPNANFEVVLAYSTWQKWFGGDRNVVGRSIPLSGQSYRIIGVMGPEFGWPTPQTDLWTPIALAPAAFSPNNQFNESYLSVARLQPGISFAQANTFTSLLSQRFAQNPQARQFMQASQWGLFLMPLSDFVFGDLSLALAILSGAVGLVLLIACANIAGLLLAKAAGRARELAVRAAMGASRQRLLAEAMAESSLLGGLGIAAGLALSGLAVRALLLAAPVSISHGLSVHLDASVLAYTVGVGVIAVVIFGCLPAWRVAQVNPYDAMRHGERGGGGGRERARLRSALVIGELALGLVLLAATGLLLTSLTHLSSVNPGFAPQGVASASVALPHTQFDTPQKQAEFFDQLVARLQEQPGVAAAGAGNQLPFTGANGSASFAIEGRALAAGDPGPHGDVRAVTPGYFTALRIPLMAGRLFTDADRGGSLPVAIIDTNLAQEYWPGQNPLGQHIGGPQHWIEVVGVVGHIRFTQLAGDEGSAGAGGVQSATKGAYYFPLAQQPGTSAYVLARAAAGNNAAGLNAAIVSAIRTTDAELPVSDVHTMPERIDQSLGPQHFVATLLGVFAVLALLLAAIGLYGLISFSVTQRSCEIAIRVALGAEPGDVLGMILTQGARLAAIGAAGGIVIALAFTQFLRTFLYGVNPTDPRALGLAAIALLIVAMAATFIPAWRATRVDPNCALRAD